MANDFYSETVKRLHGVADGWKWFALDAHNKPEDFIEIKGGVPIGVVTRGRRKGRPKWSEKYDTFFIRMKDVEDTRYAWSIKTGLCWECEGEGGRTSRIDGTCRQCRECGGTGTPRGWSLVTADGEVTPCHDTQVASMTDAKA